MADFLTAARDAYAAGPGAAPAGSGSFQSPNQPLPDAAPAANGGAMAGATTAAPIDYATPFAIDRATGQLYAGGQAVPTDIAQWQQVAADPSKVAPMSRDLILQHGLQPLTPQQLHAAIEQITAHATAPVASNIGASFRSMGRQVGDAAARFDAVTNEYEAKGAHALGLDALGDGLSASAKQTRAALAQWQQDQQTDSADTRAGLTMQEQAGNDAGFMQHPGTYIAAKGGSFIGAAGPAIAGMAVNPAFGAGLITAQSAGGSAQDAEGRVRAAIQHMTPDQLMPQSPAYAHLIQQGHSDTDAREAIISAAGDTAGGVGAGIGAATTALYDFGGKGISALAPGITAKIAGASGDSFVARALTGRGLAGLPLRAGVRGVEGASVMQGQQMASNAAGAAAAGVGSTNPADYYDQQGFNESLVGFGAMGALTPMRADPMRVAQTSDIGAAANASAAHDAAAAPQGDMFANPDLQGPNGNPGALQPNAAVVPHPGQGDLFGPAQGDMVGSGPEQPPGAGPTPPPTAPAVAAPAAPGQAEMFGPAQGDLYHQHAATPPEAPAAPTGPDPAQGNLLPGNLPAGTRGALIKQRAIEQAQGPQPQGEPAALPPPGPTAGQHDAVANLQEQIHHAELALEAASQPVKRRPITVTDPKTGAAKTRMITPAEVKLEKARREGAVPALQQKLTELHAQLKEANDAVAGQEIGLAREQRPEPTGASFVGDPASGQQEIPFGPGHEPSGDPRLTGDQLPVDYKPGTSVEPPPLPNPVPMSPEEAASRLKAQRARNPENREPQGDLFPKELKKGLAERAQPPVTDPVTLEDKVAESTPEPAADLQAQADRLGKGSDALFVAKGNEAQLPKVRKGVRKIVRDEGTLFTTNPKKAELFRKAKLTDAMLAQIQGLPETKEAALQGGEPAVVAAEDANGNVVKEAVGTPGGPNDAVVAAATPKGGKTVRRTALQAQARRAAKLEAEPKVPPLLPPVKAVPDAPKRSRLDTIKDAAASKKATARAGLKKKVPVTAEELAAHDAPAKPAAEPAASNAGKAEQAAAEKARAELEAKTKAATDTLLADVTENHPQYLTDAPEEKAGPGRKETPPILRIPLTDREMGELSDRVLATAEHEAAAIGDGSWTAKRSVLRRVFNTMGLDIPREADLRRVVLEFAKAPIEDVRALLAKKAHALMDSTLMKGVVRGVDVIQHAVAEQDKNRHGLIGLPEPDVAAMAVGKGGKRAKVAAPERDEAASTDRVTSYAHGLPANVADTVTHWIKVLDKHGEKFTDAVHVLTPEQAIARYGAAIEAHMTGEGLSGMAMGPDGKLEPFIAVDWKALGEGPAAMEALAHEMGHLTERRIFDAMPEADKAAVRSAFNDWLQTSGRGTPSEQMLSRLSPALAEIMRKGGGQPDRAYASEWREWIADETAKWLLTSEKPRSGVDRFFARIGNALKMLYAQVAGAGKPTEAVQHVFDNWVAASRDLRSADAAARAIEMNYNRDASEAPRPAEEARAKIAARAMRAKAELAVAGAAAMRDTMSQALDGDTAGLKRSINNAVVGIKHGAAGQLLQKTVVALSNMNDIVGRYGGKQHGAFGEGLTRWDHVMRLAEKYSKDAQQAGQIAMEKAQRLSRPVQRALEDLMYKSTVYAMHPDEPFGKGRNKHLIDEDDAVTEANRQRYGEIATAWRQLEGIQGDPQGVYEGLRAAMATMHEDLFEARRENIDGLDISTEAKEEAHRLLNLAEQQRLKGPYFPLVREGNYITTALMPQTSLGSFGSLAEAKAAERRAKAINPHATVNIEKIDGEYSVHAAEKAVYYHSTLADAYKDRAAIEAELREAWTHAGIGRSFDEMLGDEQTPLISQPFGTTDFFRKAEVPTSGKFMTEVNRLREGEHIDPQAYKMLSEMYVDSLPESAPGKSFLHRENVRGASLNMLAGYSRRLLGAAHSYGQTKIGPERNKAWALMDKNRKANPEYAGVMNTLYNRQKILGERMTHDPTNRFASAVQDASSFLSLGFSPAFLLQQVMQPLVVSAPVIAARMGLNGKAVGYAKTMDALKTAYEGAVPFFTKRGTQQFLTEYKRALGTYGGNGLTLQESAEALINTFGKTDDEKAMLRYMNERGTLDFSFLNAVSDATSLSAAGAKAKAVLRMSMALPQQVEAMNRTVTGLAAYRLAMSERGMEHADAVREANTIVVQTHGDYSRYNRPSVFNRPLAGMALQFKMYTQFMYSLLASNVAHGMDPRLSRAERAQAWRTLGYVLGSHAAFGGVVGLGPVAGAAKLALGGVLWAAASAGLIDKKKKDQTVGDQVAAGFEDWGDEMFGKGAGHTLRAVGTYGLPALMGVDFADKIALPDLTDTKFTGKPSAKDQPGDVMDRYVLTALGPVYSNAKRMGNGMGALVHGDLHGAAKQMLPPAPRAWLNAATEAQDGIVTSTGKTLKGSKDIGPYDTFVRAMGFSTTDTAMMYDDRSRRQAAIDRYQASRDKLVAAYRGAKGEDRAAVRAQITEYNKGRPKELQISEATLQRATSAKGQGPSQLEKAAGRAIGEKP